MTSSNFHDPSACCKDTRLDRGSPLPAVWPGPECDNAFPIEMFESKEFCCGAAAIALRWTGAAIFLLGAAREGAGGGRAWAEQYADGGGGAMQNEADGGGGGAIAYARGEGGAMGYAPGGGGAMKHPPDGGGGGQGIPHIIGITGSTISAVMSHVFMAPFTGWLLSSTATNAV